ncbi:hypothetical protein Aph01nite_22190 [Acrocarpospora phusangensis]|uniref:Novel STAND NTPase 1 domain-containing protein n=1 Tax=Acrocarpospora phusangensis TaxID=1070424 RepID=A0A919Q7K2_9ACTN|nr:ATP-binding protein [Acrocarpospora phusangensis]GIH23909.1 hypothetical protein Aph01nite_22190 [Acrocarpospora phusangensis]
MPQPRQDEDRPHQQSERIAVQAGRDQHIAGGDLHLHYQDGVREARRAEGGAEPGECPYPGLAAFEAGQARWFFGRDEMTAELLVRLDERWRTGGPLMIVAPSGAGKSSLLRAGLLPALARGGLAVSGSAHWPQILTTPTAHPLRALMAGLGAALDKPEIGQLSAVSADAVAPGPVGRVDSDGLSIPTGLLSLSMRAADGWCW